MKKPSLPFLIILFVAGALVHKGLAKKAPLITNSTTIANTGHTISKVTTAPKTQSDDGPLSSKTVFSIHKIVSSTTHYLLHLQQNGKLETWSIIKGPSCNPLQKRKAVKKDTMPLDYLLFEGATLNKHKYKEGVLVWDHGTYTFETKPNEHKLSIIFNGNRMKGLYTLQKKNNAWTFAKEEDAFADIRKNITRTFTRSSLSGLTLTHIFHQANNK